MDWVAILAGGSGSRFWPLSTAEHPKQLLPLAGPVPTAVATLQVVEPLVPRDRILVVTSRELAGPLQRALALPADNVLVEPRAASTAPALVWATHEAHRRDPDATVLSMHADWQLADPAGFRSAAATALATARELDLLVTTGITPTRVELGYGYIVPGLPVEGSRHAARQVARFTEKPDRTTAEQLLGQGALWNSGLFAWTARRLFLEIGEHTPEVSGALSALEAGAVDRFFAGVTPIAIDHGVFERSRRVAVLEGRFPWDDVGTWDALLRVRALDTDGNAASGPVHLMDSTDCVVWSQQTPVVVAGVRDVVVVEANGRILVVHRSRAGDLKRILDALPADVRQLE